MGQFGSGAKTTILRTVTGVLDALRYLYAPACIAIGRAGAATRHLVNAEVIEALHPQAWIINISRGSVIDEAALIDALERKAIGGAGLDVFENEPHIDTRFHKLENVVLFPHHASGTVETRAAMSQLVVDNLKAHFRGEPLPSPV